MSRQKEKRPLWLRLGLVIFILAFLLGAFMAGRILLERRASRSANDFLRSEVQRQQFNAAITTPSSVSATETEEGAEEMELAKADGRRWVCTLDFTALREYCGDMVAWLCCEGTPIDYPVMHTDNNEYYLEHLYNGKYNGAGELFVDCRNSGLFDDWNSVIYGHHMQNGSMFAVLVEYKDQSFYDARPTMTLCTPQGDYLVELFAGTIEDGADDFVQFSFETPEEFVAYCAALKERSTFRSPVEVGPEDKIITMCTCTYEFNNARYALYGKLVPVME